MNSLKTRPYIFLFLFSLVAIHTSAQQTAFDFIENKGQWDKRAKYMGKIGAGEFFLEKKGFTVFLHNADDLKSIFHHSHNASPVANSTGNNAALSSNSNLPGNGGPDGIGSTKYGTPVVRSHAYRVYFEGASDDVRIIPGKQQDEYNNYFIGNDKSQWGSHCNIYKTVTYNNVYPGIDVRYYSDNGTLKYDVVINPGANPALIAMKYVGAEGLSIRNNQLYIKTSVGDVKELYPYSYQFDKIKGRTDVQCKYEIVNGNTVKFKLKNYDPSQPLIIDPTLIFSSFTGSAADQWGFTATPGPDGSLYSGGIVFGAGYPLTPGAIQNTFAGGIVDMGITRFNPLGTARIFSTYIGGGGDDLPLSMIADGQANLVIMGRTTSSNFPGTLIGNGGSGDLFVLKLNNTGTALIGALRIGGTGLDAANIEIQRPVGPIREIRTLRFYGDDSRGEVILDGNNNIYVATQSQSDDFPMKNALQATRAGKQDGVILKIDPNCSGLIFSTYLGGTDDDGAFVMDISPTTGNLYIAGATSSTDFPGNKTGVIQPANAGGRTDGFIVEMANDGSSIIRSTYLGTNNYDAIYGIKFDKFGFPYVMGVTEGAWTVFNATYSVANGKQFISKLKTDLSGYVYSTIFGNSNATPNSLPNISPVAFLVDRCENVYMSGWGGWIAPGSNQDPYRQQGVVNLPITPGALKSTTDNKDFYFIVIKKNATGLLYGSYFGQGGGYGEHVDGGTSRFDQQGVIYQAICANCEGNNIPGGQVTVPYPTTPGVVGPVNGAGDHGCNLGAVKISFNFAGVDAGIKAFINAVYDTVGCVPLDVEFKDTVRVAASYEWDFGDGSPSVATTNFDIFHRYTLIGDYKVRLIGIDSSTCNIRDTAYVTIRVRDNQAFLGFVSQKLLPCESLSYQFTNTSTKTATAKPFDNQSFIWDFGDGTPRVVSGPSSIQHFYVAPGTYKVKLILPDTGYCNSPDSVSQDLRVAPLVKAQFETPAAGCAPYNAVFNNTSLAGQTFFWDFGDGSTSTATNPTHNYSAKGTYTIKLVATDTSTCNKIDSITVSINVSDKPKADYTYSPLTPQENFPYTFTNASSPDATRFLWSFGDGDTLPTRSRANFDHQYNKTGTFNACLTAYNDVGCADTICKPLQNIVVPKLDLPNAFTPLSNTTNSYISVKGFGIGKMKWRIYNRFGNLVFESDSQSKGWDGKYKGVVQPMDVYAYTLDVEFTDGTKATKKGDITLLR